MTGRINSGECEAMRATCLSRNVSINVPSAQWKRYKVRLAVPLEFESPRLVSNPVAYPIVRPDVDEYAHSALQQRCDVVHRAVQAILRCTERRCNWFGADGESFGDVRVDAKLLIDIRAIEEARNGPK